MKVIEKRDDTQNGLRAYAFAPVKMVNLIKSILLWDMLAQILSVFMIYLQMLNFDFIITQKPKINNYYKNLNHTTINKSYNDFSDDNDIVNSTYNVTKEAFKNSFSLQNTLNSPNLLKRKFQLQMLMILQKWYLQMAESVAFTKAIKRNI